MAGGMTRFDSRANLGGCLETPPNSVSRTSESRTTGIDVSKEEIAPMPTAPNVRAGDAEQTRRRRGWLRVVVLAVVCATSVFLWTTRQSRNSSLGHDLSAEVEEAFRSGDFERTIALARSIAREDPSWPESQLLAARSAEQLDRPDEAVRHLHSIRGENLDWDARISYSMADAYRRLGHISEAEREFRRILHVDPEHTQAHAGRIYLLSITGRRWECEPHYEHLLRSETYTLKSLAGMSAPDRFLEHPEYLEFCFERAPEDWAVRQGLGAAAFLEGDLSAAKRWLREVVEENPESLSAQSLLGEILVAEDESSFQAWHQSLPAGADRQPDVWYVRGLWARRLSRNEIAARCFWETLRRAPLHRGACQHLGQILTSLEDPSAGEYVEHARRLTELSHLIDEVMRSEGRLVAPLLRIIDLMERCGRTREARAWALTGILSADSDGELRRAADRLSAAVSEADPRGLVETLVTSRHDLSHFPDHRELFRDVPVRRPGPTVRAAASIRFEEDTEAGIRHVYFNSSDASAVGVRIFEPNGGGVGILDYDNDGWPDVYLTQGAEWAQGEQSATESARYVDRLFQNRNGRFVDRTEAAGLGCRGYGQGCSVGDVNNDGFADLYVANIGRNHLYLNNGDGTFTDATSGSGLDREEWTASCVIVDLNADGFPELYDVNYVTGPDVYTHRCIGGSCGPQRYEPVPDCLYVSQGDGTFRLVAGATPREGANGLGVVAAVIDDPRRPWLLIANDRTANFLLGNFHSDDEFRVRLENRGFLSGIAYNEFGASTGSMGIAADDVNGNGLLDFFVTNFSDESNTLYLQEPPGLFVDATRQAGLWSVSLPFVGWGAQFLDADLDGNPDLVVTNGHVDRYQQATHGYEMRPQFFQNLGGGRFEELSGDRIGGWFSRRFLGRGLARLDSDRDGRMDFVVSNIGQPASLVANRTSDHGRFFNVRLHARHSSRDAIGATVEIRSAHGIWKKQLLAGDGFMASNERLIPFGIGVDDVIESVHVSWPSGSVSQLHGLAADTTLTVTENQAVGTLWKGLVPESVAVELR
jgi:tetratricopeptide (TPR) repeat protein